MCHDESLVIKVNANNARFHALQECLHQWAPLHLGPRLWGPHLVVPQMPSGKEEKDWCWSQKKSSWQNILDLQRYSRIAAYLPAMEGFRCTGTMDVFLSTSISSLCLKAVNMFSVSSCHVRHGMDIINHQVCTKIVTNYISDLCVGSLVVSQH